MSFDAPPPDAIGELLRNPYALARLCRVGQLDLEAALGVDDEHFAAFDELLSTHGEDVADEEDDELVTRTISVPLYCRDGVWQVEYFDNGDDAGVVHRMWRADASEPARTLTVDAHSSGEPLSWREALALVHQIRDDARNRASGADRVSLLLLWPATRAAATDDAAEIERELGAAWRASGVVSTAVADELAREATRSSRRR